MKFWPEGNIEGDPESYPVPRGHIFMVIVASVCGLGGGACAVALRELIHLIQEAFYGDGGSLLEVASHAPWAWRLLAPALGGVLVGPLVYIVAREARGHGVPEVMEALLTRGGTIRPRVVVVKALASAITIGSGGSVGREGPIVQIGSALGSSIGQLLRLSHQQVRTLVGCGAAAGIAAAFNAPVAGALFAVEILLGDFGVPQFSPIVISSVTATIVSRHFLGNFPAFHVPRYELVSSFELALYGVLGVVAGFVALGFVKALYRSEELFERLPIPDLLKSPLGGLAVGAIGIGLPHVFGVGYSTINDALTGTLTGQLMIALLIAKIAATTLTLASGGSGGIFAPSLFLGAMTGGIVGTIAHTMFPTMTAAPGAYALVGMGAVVAAATHGPITAIVIIFELTGDYRIIPPLMAACVISTLLASWLSPDSVYTLKLTLRGLDPFRREHPNILNQVHVGEVVEHDTEIIQSSTPLGDVIERVMRSHRNEFFVVRPDGTLLGSFSLSDLRAFLFESQSGVEGVLGADLAAARRPRVTEQDDLDSVMHVFGATDADEIAVVADDGSGKLIGSIRRRELIKARNREMLRRDLPSQFATSVHVADRIHQIELTPGVCLREMPVPLFFIGRTPLELELRTKFGAELVLVRRARDKGQSDDIIMPRSDLCFEKGDRVLLSGPSPALDVLTNR